MYRVYYRIFQTMPVCSTSKNKKKYYLKSIIVLLKSNVIYNTCFIIRSYN